MQLGERCCGWEVGQGLGGAPGCWGPCLSPPSGSVCHVRGLWGEWVTGRVCVSMSTSISVSIMSISVSIPIYVFIYIYFSLLSISQSGYFVYIYTLTYVHIFQVHLR